MGVRSFLPLIMQLRLTRKDGKWIWRSSPQNSELFMRTISSLHMIMFGARGMLRNSGSCRIGSRTKVIQDCASIRSSSADVSWSRTALITPSGMSWMLLDYLCIHAELPQKGLDMTPRWKEYTSPSTAKFTRQTCSWQFCPAYASTTQKSVKFGKRCVIDLSIDAQIVQ